MTAVALRTIPVGVGDIELEIETTPVAGTEATSTRASKAAEGVVDAFEKARQAIVEISASIAEVIEATGARAARPRPLGGRIRPQGVGSGQRGCGRSGGRGHPSGQSHLRRQQGFTRQVSPRGPAPVPDYLGRVLAPGGEAVGTCFQVAPAVIVTAAHVLADIGAEGPDAEVGIEPLGEGEPRQARVKVMDELVDLAVLVADAPLAGSVAGLVATDGVAHRTPVVVTGFAEVPDDHHYYGHLDATGTWEGTATRDAQLSLGRMESKAVMRGMSGAPVRRLSDQWVVGVVSGRYNSADGWLRDTAWVARTEHLESMLDGLADVVVAQPAPAGRMELTLEVNEADVRLRGSGIEASAPHAGVSPGLVGAVDDVRRQRARVGTTRSEAALDDGPGALALGTAGRLLAASFLPHPVAQVFRNALSRAEAAHKGLSLGIQVSGTLARLPWEALPTPGGSRPLALEPLVDVYRRSPGGQVRPVPGPLRILVAISSPEQDGSEPLDYEAELRNVVDAVRAARAGEAHVRVVRFATTAGIFSALEAQAAHILHISAHGSPGRLVLEDDDGAPRSLEPTPWWTRPSPPGPCRRWCAWRLVTPTWARPLRRRLLPPACWSGEPRR